MKVCKLCGANNVDDIIKCGNCGEAIDKNKTLQQKEVEENAILLELQRLNNNIDSLNNAIRGNSRVLIVDVEMTFLSMIVFMIKWVIASIPVLIALFFAGLLFAVFFTEYFASSRPF